MPHHIVTHGWGLGKHDLTPRGIAFGIFDSLEVGSSVSSAVKNYTGVCGQVGVFNAIDRFLYETHPIFVSQPLVDPLNVFWGVDGHGSKRHTRRDAFWKFLCGYYSKLVLGEY
jgi:hypothetical protein